MQNKRVFCFIVIIVIITFFNCVGVVVPPDLNVPLGLAKGTNTNEIYFWGCNNEDIFSGYNIYAMNVTQISTTFQQYYPEDVSTTDISVKMRKIAQKHIVNKIEDNVIGSFILKNPVTNDIPTYRTSIMSESTKFTIILNSAVYISTSSALPAGTYYIGITAFSKNEMVESPMSNVIEMAVQ